MKTTEFKATQLNPCYTDQEWTLELEAHDLVKLQVHDRYDEVEIRFLDSDNAPYMSISVTIYKRDGLVDPHLQLGFAHDAVMLDAIIEALRLASDISRSYQ